MYLDYPTFLRVCTYKLVGITNFIHWLWGLLTFESKRCMPSCLNFYLLLGFMIRKTYCLFAQALAGAYHCPLSCYFLLELALASSCDLIFESESLVSGSPILCLAPGTFPQYCFDLGNTMTPSLCQIHCKLPHQGGPVFTARHSLAGSSTADSTPDSICLSLTSLQHSVTLNKIPGILSNLQNMARL